MSAQPFPASKYALQPSAHRQRPGPALARGSEASRKEQVRRDQEASLRLKRKIDQACRILDMLEEIDGRLAAAIRSLQKRRSRLAARFERIEQRCLNEMLQAGFDVAPGIARELHAKPCPPAVEIECLAKIPATYLRTTEVSAPDKIAIKAALQRREEIPGASLTSKVSLIRK